MSFDSQCRLFSDDGTTLSPISVKRPPKNNMPFRCQERFISKQARVLYQKKKKKDNFQGPGAISKLLKKLKLPFSPITQLRFMGHVGNLGQTSYRQL